MRSISALFAVFALATKDSKNKLGFEILKLTPETDLANLPKENEAIIINFYDDCSSD